MSKSVFTNVNILFQDPPRFWQLPLWKYWNRLDGIETETFMKGQKRKSIFVREKGSGRFISFQANGEEWAMAF